MIECNPCKCHNRLGGIYDCFIFSSNLYSFFIKLRFRNFRKYVTHGQSSGDRVLVISILSFSKTNLIYFPGRSSLFQSPKHLIYSLVRLPTYHYHHNNFTHQNSTILPKHKYFTSSMEYLTKSILWGVDGDLFIR